jgi:hypothetical protein
MPVIQHIKQKFQNSYLVWLKSSNLYLQLEEPAWFVFKKTVKRFKAETIASECVDRYGLTPEESLKYVTDIRSGIERMNVPAEIGLGSSHYPDDLLSYVFEPYSVYCYKFGERLIEFSYETRNFEYYIHPLIKHLETSETTAEKVVFELFAYYDKIALRLKGEIKGLWTYDETHHVKGVVFMNMINVIFDKRDDFWLMTVHASAVTNGRKTILLPAEPGSGKTTMAAMLQDRGFKLVSDDFVPMDRLSNAYPFPIAMSVKQGSVELLSSIYADLEQKEMNYITPEKVVRYLNHETCNSFDNRAFPVNEFIFIKYDQSVDFKLESIDPLSGVKLLLEQSWVSGSKGTPELLFEFVTKWSFFRLTYSNNSKAIEAITNLFEHD